MQYAISIFYNCSALTNVYIGRNLRNADTKYFNVIGTFERQNEFPPMYVTIGQYVTSLPKNSFLASPSASLDLESATSLTTLSADAFSTFSQSSIKSVKFPSTLTSIQSGVFKSGSIQNTYFAGGNGAGTLTCQDDGVFSATTYVYLNRTVWLSDKSDDNVTFPKCQTVTMGNDLSMLEYYQFNGCTSLKNIYSIVNHSIEIRKFAFNGCTGITALDMISPLQIDQNAFNACTGLKSIRVAENTTIQSNAFSGCENISEILADYSSKADPQRVADNAFPNTCYAIATVRQIGDYDASSDKPWSQFTKKMYDSPDKLMVDIKSETELAASTHDAVEMQYASTESDAAMISLPFPMSSYYFGADAHIYTFSQAARDQDKPSAQADMFFSEIDIDACQTLPVNTGLLILTPHRDKKVLGTIDLFQERKITVDPEAYTKSFAKQGNYPIQATATALTYASSFADTETKGCYVLDEGYLKRVNSPSYIIPAFNMSLAVSKPYSLDFWELGGESISIDSHSSITPNQYLGGYATFYSELSNFEIYEPENDWPDAQVYTVSIDGTPENRSLKLTPVSDGIINKGQAVLIKAQAGKELKLRMVTSVSTDAEAYANNILKGVSTETSVDDLCSGGDSFIYVLSCNGNYQNVGFYQYSSDKTLGAGKAYISVSDISSSARKILQLPIITGINLPEAADAQPAAIYDLSGRRIEHTRTNNIYIINNKKTLMK